MANLKYSEDDKFIVYENYRKETVNVPVEVLDYLNSVHISDSALTDLKAYRRLTKFDDSGEVVSEPKVVNFESMVGADLTGKTVRVFYANWEDSEWLSSDSALTVSKSLFGEYRFVFPQDDVWNNPENYDDEEYDKIPYDVERLIGMSFTGLTQFWVA